MIASLGGELFLSYRSANKKEALAKKLLAENPLAVFHFFLFDQSSAKSIEKLANDLQDKDIDSFIFNAGIMHPKKGALTSEGDSLTFGTNALGVHLLYDRLKLSHPGSQFCFISSLTNIPPFKHDYSSYLIPDAHLRFLEYCVSKRAIMNIFVSSLEKGENVTMAHPGVAKSQIYKGLGKLIFVLGNAVLTLTTHPVWKAALPLVMLSSGNYQKGTCLVPRGVFEIWGYPKQRKIPAKAYHNKDNLEKTLCSAEKRESTALQ